MKMKFLTTLLLCVCFTPCIFAAEPQDTLNALDAAIAELQETEDWADLALALKDDGTLALTAGEITSIGDIKDDIDADQVTLAYWKNPVNQTGSEWWVTCMTDVTTVENAIDDYEFDLGASSASASEVNDAFQESVDHLQWVTYEIWEYADFIEWWAIFDDWDIADIQAAGAAADAAWDVVEDADASEDISTDAVRLSFIEDGAIGPTYDDIMADSWDAESDVDSVATGTAWDPWWDVWQDFPDSDDAPHPFR